MSEITLNSATQVVPMIYAYSTPEIKRHDGWVKIGHTEQKVKDRLKQQTHTVDVKKVLEWQGNAIYDDGTGEVFQDHAFHHYLTKLGIENIPTTEWYHVNREQSYNHFLDFRCNRGILDVTSAIDYTLREEQEMAVSLTQKYFETHENGEFLWNAKPRFGKTISSYDLCKRMNAETVLIVTNRPAIANSWYSDYVKFLGKESGYLFVSQTDSLKNKPFVMNDEEYIDYILKYEDPKNNKRIEFLSLQDLKGSLYFGGKYDKLEDILNIEWDILIIDEAHEGVDTYKTDIAFNQIKRKATLHLSGTPFKVLASDKFPEDAIFNWTYADEQKKKRDWNGETENPYKKLPKLNLYTYQMSEIIKEEIRKGIEIDGEIENFSFSLNDYFATNSDGEFVENKAVDKFLNALTTQEKFPFSTPELRKELKHTLWLLNRVDSAKALARKLQNHPVFENYKIILAAGDGKLDPEEENKKSYDEVVESIKNYDKTITISVGQLTTGVTIPEWTGILMLSDIKSPALYMQAAFRAQNPCLFRENTEFYRKENAYIFDFDPARTLTIFEEFANDLCSATSDGRGDSDQRKENVRELLNFFPVIGEDEDGKMIPLDAEKVLLIPRRIHSREVVNRGFMCDYLFQNISNIFHAPAPVLEIIQHFEACKQTDFSNVNSDTKENLSLDENGEVNMNDEAVNSLTEDIFGDRIFSDIPEKLHDAVSKIDGSSKNEDKELENLKEFFKTSAVDVLVKTAQETYGNKILKQSEKTRLEKKLYDKADNIINTAYGNYRIKSDCLKHEISQRKGECKSKEEFDELALEFEKKQKENVEKLKETIKNSIDEYTVDSGREIVKTIETAKREQEKENIEIAIKDHLRGFSRTIPSFLMAYGNQDVTLENFDNLIPDNVFKEVTSITLENFRFLRDGGDYVDQETGKTEHFDGNLFDPVVFNDSIKEFLSLKVKLANYFEESNTEDIFDYIPPQKTNQIYTPKWVVKKMVDLLEKENPGCFDDPNKTFADLYMKSGLYITEIVKKLYNSNGLKEEFPNKDERLKHIFEKQVYGLAPTEIIYKIATNFILGFSDKMGEIQHNFKLADSLIPAKEGRLDEFLDQLYGETE